MKKKNLLQRTIIIVIVSIAALYIVIGPRGRRPRASDFTWTGIKTTLRQNIRLGLDLRGGSHLVMRVKTDAYLKKLTEDNAAAARKAAQDAGFQVKDVKAETAGDYRFVLEAVDPAKLTDIEAAVKQKLDLTDWTATTGGNTITWTLPPATQRLLAEQATEQAKRIIEGRLDAFGVAEPLVQRHGSLNSYRILVQMPGIQEPERVKQLLKAESRLELVHVVSPPSPGPVQTYNTREEAIASLNSTGAIPQDRRVLPYSERDEPTTGGAPATPQAEKPKKWVVVETPPIVDGHELRNASALQGSGGSSDYQISFALKPSGADKFGKWTGANINEYMGVVLNDEVKSIAFIKSQIFDQGEITGRFTKESAEDLALTLRSGALPAPIEYQEERTVGPSLGEDSIRSGVKASLYGLLFVVAFMLFYYRGSGVNAVVALLLNMILMLAGLIVFGATLTLPGIAGMILTIGMAVDSNVLIFERIREEIASGKTIAVGGRSGLHQSNRDDHRYARDHGGLVACSCSCLAPDRCADSL